MLKLTNKTRSCLKNLADRRLPWKNVHRQHRTVLAHCRLLMSIYRPWCWWMGFLSPGHCWCYLCSIKYWVSDYKKFFFLDHHFFQILQRKKNICLSQKYQITPMFIHFLALFTLRSHNLHTLMGFEQFANEAFLRF